MARLLLLEDDQSLIDGLVYALTKEGFALDVAMTVREARAQLAAQAYDLLLLDQTLPDGSGLALCEEVRAGGNAVPIIFLTAMDEEIQVIRALDAGGDDYITKPFGMRELMAKIEANLRRERRAQGAGATQKRPRLYFGEIAIDLRARCVQVGDVQLALTKHEYAVVEFLALHPGQIFSREQIYERVWGYDAEGNADVVAEHLRKARAKIKKAGAVDPVATVWGIGYRWQKKEGAR